MAAHGLGGRVLCSSKEAHGYMAFRLWPRVTTYIDGRVPQVFPASFLQAYLEIADPAVLSREIDGRGIDHVVLVAGLYAPVNLQMAAALRARGDFALVDFDENGALWSRVRGGAWPCPECRPFELLDPYRLRRRPTGEKLEDSPALREELARLREHRESPGARSGAGGPTGGRAVGGTLKRGKDVPRGNALEPRPCGSRAEVGGRRLYSSSALKSIVSQ